MIGNVDTLLHAAVNLLLVTHPKAAIHRDYCTCDVCRSGAGEKSNNTRYLIY
jgi:hypothetical protein